jgi:hypothetical protein
VSDEMETCKILDKFYHNRRTYKIKTPSIYIRFGRALLDCPYLDIPDSDSGTAIH